MHETSAAVTGLLIFAGAIWVGGLVAIAVVARVATRSLDAAARVRFFRGLGRTYGIVGTTALVVAYGAGAYLAYGRPWNGQLTATATVATALVVVTAAGIISARRMSRLRRRLLEQPADTELAAAVHGGATQAGVLRGLIAVLSIALLALAVLVGS
ncbi:MAG TPA: hypothetical protein VIJ71_08235 [Mycobacteriales bacterium]